MLTHGDEVRLDAYLQAYHGSSNRCRSRFCCRRLFIFPAGDSSNGSDSASVGASNLLLVKVGKARDLVLRAFFNSMCYPKCPQ